MSTVKVEKFDTRDDALKFLEGVMPNVDKAESILEVVKFRNQALLMHSLAMHSDLHYFPALVDESGRLVSTKLKRFDFSNWKYTKTVMKWKVIRPGREMQWITDYKLERNFAVQGLKKIWIVAPAKVVMAKNGQFVITIDRKKCDLKV